MHATRHLSFSHSNRTCPHVTLWSMLHATTTRLSAAYSSSAWRARVRSPLAPRALLSPFPRRNLAAVPLFLLATFASTSASAMGGSGDRGGDRYRADGVRITHDPYAVGLYNIGTPVQFSSAGGGGLGGGLGGGRAI